jgi:hypothetical protein
VAHRSHVMGARRASMTCTTELVTSGPMPSPGIRVTLCSLCRGEWTCVHRCRC